MDEDKKSDDGRNMRIEKIEVTDTNVDVRSQKSDGRERKVNIGLDLLVNPSKQVPSVEADNKSDRGLAGFDLNENNTDNEGLISDLNNINIEEKQYYDDDQSHHSNNANEFPFIFKKEDDGDERRDDNDRYEEKRYDDDRLY